MSDNFLLDDANSTDQDTIRISGIAYPWVQWIAGDSDQDDTANVRYHGGFFAPTESIDLAGNKLWTPSHIKRTDKDGKKIQVEGFYAKDLHIAVINQRHRYEVRASDTGQPELFSHTEYDKADARAKQLQAINPQCSPKKKSQFLIIIKGMEDTPITLTLRSTVAKQMSGQNGLLQAFDRTVMAFVNSELAKAGTANRLPVRRFWVHVGIALDAKGKPDFRPIGPKGKTTDMIMPTLWGIPPKLTMDYIKTIHTGAGNKAKFDALYTETLDWSKAWDGIQAGSKAEGAPTTAAPAAAPVDAETAKMLANL